MPIGKDIAQFAETLSARHQSNVQEKGSSDWLRDRTMEESREEISRLRIAMYDKLRNDNRIAAKAYALDIANEARNIWEKL